MPIACTCASIDASLPVPIASTGAQKPHQHEPQGQDAQVGDVFSKQVFGPESGQQSQQ